MDSNKKVLLRESKRHTACHVASAHYAALSNGGGLGTPPPSSPGQGQVPLPPTIQTWSRGGTPDTPHHPDLARGYHATIQTWDGVSTNHPDLGWGTPDPPRPGMGCPPPRPGMGYSPPRPGMGYSPQDLGWGTPIQSRCGLTNKLQTVPSPILRMRAVIRTFQMKCLKTPQNKLN